MEVTRPMTLLTDYGDTEAYVLIVEPSVQGGKAGLSSWMDSTRCARAPRMDGAAGSHPEEASRLGTPPVLFVLQVGPPGWWVSVEDADRFVAPAREHGVDRLLRTPRALLQTRADYLSLSLERSAASLRSQV